MQDDYREPIRAFRPSAIMEAEEAERKPPPRRKRAQRRAESTGLFLAAAERKPTVGRRKK